MAKRVFLIVLDSFGIGAEPDAEQFGDAGTNTLAAVAGHPAFRGENLAKLGLFNIDGVTCGTPCEHPMGSFARLREASAGKDTTIGHWEIAGMVSAEPLPTFPNGFPQELLDELSKRCDGRKIIGNKAASGTEILDELAEQEIQNGDLIVYTSADSVLQICGNEETMGVDTLYRYCESARELTMRPEWKVGRVIARPYTGKKKGEFVRTSNRHDYALKPYGTTALNVLKEHGYDVISVGKIRDIFDGEGITQAHKSKSSVHGMEQTLEIADQDFTGLCFVNLVDFDALWGHRRNPIGYGEELERFDALLGQLLQKMRPDDLVMVTADHGNDPTYKGTDHTREMVPLMMVSPSMKEQGILEDEKTFAVIGATILDNFGLEMPENTIGHSLLDQLK